MQGWDYTDRKSTHMRRDVAQASARIEPIYVRARRWLRASALAAALFALALLTARADTKPVLPADAPAPPPPLLSLADSTSEGAGGESASSPSPPASYADDPTSEKEPQEQIVRVGLDQRVTVHVSGLPLADALRMLSEPTKRNILLANGVEGTVTASLYNVSVEQALQAMLVSNGLGFRVEGDFTYVYPQEELAKIAQSQRKIVTQVFHLTYLNAATAKGMLEPMLSNIGKMSTTPAAHVGLGGDDGMEDTKGDAPAGTDSLIVTDYEDRVAAIEKTLADLDVRPRQVLVEATILRATLNEDNALGIDFTTVGGIDFSTLSSVSPAAQTITTGLIPNENLSDTNFTVRTNFNDALPAGGFTFGILKDQVGVFVRALEQITDTDILANPKLMALNKQVGQVIVGRRDGYLTTTITETTAIQQVEFLETGTVLTFRPFIGHDDMVRMEIHPKDSTGGLTDTNLPFEQTTEVTTNILVKDGRTILIGGLFREVGTATRGQMPLLGNIPVAGALFRRTRDATVREEVIILLTVHIIKSDHEKDYEAGNELNEDIERMRVGARKGIQWFGRERTSEAHYRWAMEHLAKGDCEKALWDADMALQINPRHLHAAKLKEKLICKRDWETEASAVRTHLRDLIEEEETGRHTPPFGRPAPPFVLPEGLEGPTGIEEETEADGREDDMTAPTNTTP
jgi:type II secretory pathway component GspD/PulD (secretin)